MELDGIGGESDVMTTTEWGTGAIPASAAPFRAMIRRCVLRGGAPGRYRDRRRRADE